MILNLVKTLVTNPLTSKNKIKALFRFVRWQISVWINPFPTVYPFTQHSKLIIKKSMTGTSGNLYCGLYE